MGQIFAFLILALLTGLSLILLSYGFGGLFAFVILVGLLLLLAGLVAPYAILNLSSDPPEKALMTFLGKPIDDNRKLEGPGLVFLIPFWNGYFPFLHGGIPILMTEQPGEGTVLARTPNDLVEVQLPFEFDIRARDYAKSAIELLRSGGIKEAVRQVQDMILQVIRDWVRSSEFGPGTWEEAEKAKFDLYVLVWERIIEKPIVLFTEFPEVPNYILIKYFNQRGPTTVEVKNIRCGGEDWHNLKEKLDSLSPERLETLKGDALAYEKEIAKLRRGESELHVPGVGMDLVRFNIGNVKETGKMAEIAAREAEEAKQQAALVIRTSGVNARAKTIKSEHPGISDERALEEAKVIDGIVPKTVTETQIGITAGTVDALAKGIGEVLAKILGRNDDGKNK